MKNQVVISNKQAISLLILFIIGESSIFIEGFEAKKDLWIAIILAIVFTIPLVLIFARLHVLFPNKNLLDIMEICLGKYLGKALIALYTWFFFHTVVLILEDIGFFVSTVLFPETPFIIIVIVFALTCTYCVKQGLEVLGRWAEFFIIIPIVIEILVFLLLIPKMEITNILPILYDGIGPVAKGTFLTITFPFAYIVGLASVFAFSKDKNSPYKIYFSGILIGGVIVFMSSFKSTLVLGEDIGHYFPTYVTVSRIRIGNFLQRLDILAVIVFMIGIYVEVSAFLLATCIGITKLFDFADYKFIVMPITLLILNICFYEFDSIMHYFEFGREIWPYYVFPFEIIFPCMLWITAEVKIKIKRKKLID
ncbi:MAG: spore gernimation protein [Firmicutes bacterium HGW-Firmicutes-1]|jgi:spore germination protein KB|nr:MAG: spore gernimation protein [Firmicutes bacterium HGW-Firmicutes-1]